MTIKEAYKNFYTSEMGKLILADLMRYVEIDKPVYRPGDKIEDAIYQSACQNVLYYILGECNTSLQKEIEENDGRTREDELAT